MPSHKYFRAIKIFSSRNEIFIRTSLPESSVDSTAFFMTAFFSVAKLQPRLMPYNFLSPEIRICRTYFIARYAVTFTYIAKNKKINNKKNYKKASQSYGTVWDAVIRARPANGVDGYQVSNVFKRNDRPPALEVT